MKNKLTAAMKVMLSLVLCLVMLFTALPETKADAAAKMTNKKAQKILKKKIKNKFCRYAFVDVDKDKIDELIVLGFSGEFVDGDDKEKTLTVYKISGKTDYLIVNVFTGFLGIGIHTVQKTYPHCYGPYVQIFFFNHFNFIMTYKFS